MTEDGQDQEMSLEKAEKIMNNYEDYSRVSVNKASRRISKEKDLSGAESSDIVERPERELPQHDHEEDESSLTDNADDAESESVGPVSSQEPSKNLTS